MGAKERLLRIAVLALLYTAVGKLGLSLDAVSGFATLVWPPTGLALAALLLYGSSLWPGVFLGAFAVNLWVGAPPAAALGIASGNTAEALLGAYALRRFGGFNGSFDGLRHVLALILGAAGVSTLVSATCGVASLALAGIVRSPHQAVETWRAWWVGDVLGNLVVAPLLLTWLRPADHVQGRLSRPIAEAVLLALLVTLVNGAMFFRTSPATYPFESPYVLFPLLVWAALRFELRGASLVAAYASLLAVWGTARGHGPFAREALSSGLLALQTFMGCAAITPLIVAGMTMDRARAIQTHETFVAAVSHDLKNTVNALLMSGESLCRRPTQEVMTKHYDILKRSAHRMLRLIADLVDAAAIERGVLALEQKVEDTQSLVSEGLDLLRPMATAKRLVIQSEEIDSIPLACDRGRLLQVLSNIVGNAVKFCPEQARIRVTVKRLNDRALFSIRDSGPGIAPEDLPHVFERYWHAKASAGGGSGLGLFIAKGIVEAHGGRIWAESAPGSGCTIHITLPAVRPEN